MFVGEHDVSMYVCTYITRYQSIISRDIYIYIYPSSENSIMRYKSRKLSRAL